MRGPVIFESSLNNIHNAIMLILLMPASLFLLFLASFYPPFIKEVKSCEFNII